MDAGRLLIIAGGTLAGVWLLSRFAASSAGGVSASNAGAVPTANGVSVAPTVTDFGPVVPQLGAFYAVAKPLADKVTTPLINKINSAVGGATPYGPLKNVKQNPDGSYTGTDGLGATVTLNPDGTIHRTNPSFSQTNGGKVLIAAGHGIAKGATAVGHAASAAYHWVEGFV